MNKFPLRDSIHVERQNPTRRMHRRHLTGLTNASNKNLECFKAVRPLHFV